MYEADGVPKWGVPKNKDMKLQLAKFSAKETYKGLVTGVNEWANRFVRQIERAQMASGFCWDEDIKMDVLEGHLEGKALEFWQIKREAWSNSTLEALSSFGVVMPCTRVEDGWAWRKRTSS
jgi:hypothetical protein